MFTITKDEEYNNTTYQPFQIQQIIPETLEFPSRNQKYLLSKLGTEYLCIAIIPEWLITSGYYMALSLDWEDEDTENRTILISKAKEQKQVNRKIFKKFKWLDSRLLHFCSR